MAEEFQESDVVFGECVEDEERESSCCNFPLPESRNYCISSKGKRKKLKVMNNKKSSVPVNVPRNAWFRYVESDDIDGGEGEMVPPHVIIGRRVAGKVMAFSVCTGKGRTLKGRDLSEVRNSILRMTGFLET
ncbi:hypothetical protein Salat_2063000 [Sesamum alatum]|uniref:Senescence regulator n=1 Tax=Sesamum alatum TaxID=300844 RepID=A0AAE1XZW0_9LAMI|nr:hypothetical protein Salat_2063000 [Sesamum alatum]